MLRIITACSNPRNATPMNGGLPLRAANYPHASRKITLLQADILSRGSRRVLNNERRIRHIKAITGNSIIV